MSIHVFCKKSPKRVLLWVCLTTPHALKRGGVVRRIRTRISKISNKINKNPLTTNPKCVVEGIF